MLDFMLHIMRFTIEKKHPQNSYETDTCSQPTSEKSQRLRHVRKFIVRSIEDTIDSTLRWRQVGERLGDEMGGSEKKV